MATRQMEAIQKKLAMLNYSRANAPAQSLLFSSMERYALLEWLFFRLLGDKSPFSQQNIQGDALDRDEETARIQYLAEIAKLLGITTTVDTEAIQGHGSYEERTEMLRLIVDLVEATIYADNPEWSVDEQVAKDIQLIDSIAEKQAQIFLEGYKLFPADVQIQSIYPLPDVSELESKLSEQSKILLNLQQKVDDLASKHAYNPDEEYAEVESQLRTYLESFLQTARTFNLIYTKIAMTINTSGNLSLQSILEKDKLSVQNFPEWYSYLRTVLKHEKKLYVLEHRLPEAPATTAPKADKDAYKKHNDDALEIGCFMLATMNSRLQKQHENMEAYDMIINLKMLFQEEARHERIRISRALFQCKLAEGNPVGPHVLQMIGYIENLERLGYPLGLALATNLILQSLPDSYSQFVMNYILNKMDKSLPVLASMLRTAEQILEKGKGKTILMVQNGKEQKDKGKKKFKPSTSSLKRTSGNLSLQSILEKDKLSIQNFPEWYSYLRIVLKHEKKLYVLEHRLPEAPAAAAPKADKDAYKKHNDDALEIGCFMLATMNSELQKQHENMEAYDMIVNLKMLFQEETRHERFWISRALFQCKLAEGNPVGPHVLQMIGYIENLERLGYPLGLALATNLILQSLPDSYSQFVMNYIMNNMDKSLLVLASMLRTAEQILEKGKGKTILMAQNGKEKKDKGKKKFKPSTSSLKPVGGVRKKGACFCCGQTGHWKRNYERYLELEECKKRKVSDASIKEIRPWTHMMEVPQLHGFGPAANRLLEAYKMLLKFLGNLRNLRDSHAALAFGSSETSEGPSSVTKIISECESALTDLNRSLGILSASIAREQGNKMST